MFDLGDGTQRMFDRLKTRHKREIRKRERRNPRYDLGPDRICIMPPYHPADRHVPSEDLLEAASIRKPYAIQAAAEMYRMGLAFNPVLRLLTGTD